MRHPRFNSQPGSIYEEEHNEQEQPSVDKNCNYLHIKSSQWANSSHPIRMMECDPRIDGTVWGAEALQEINKQHSLFLANVFSKHLAI